MGRRVEVLPPSGRRSLLPLVQRRRVAGGPGSESGDLIGPEQDLGSSPGFSQHSCSRRETERESLNQATD